MCASWLALVRTVIQFLATRLTHRELARDFDGDANGGVRETIGAAGYGAGADGYAVGGVTGGVTDRDTRVPDCTTICSGATAVGTSAAGAGASMFVHAAIVSRTTSVSVGVIAPNVSAGALATTWSTLSSAALFGRDLARDCAELRA
jgi:hypothetical protein